MSDTKQGGLIGTLIERLEQTAHSLWARGHEGAAENITAVTRELRLRQGCDCSCCNHNEGSDCACDCHVTGKCAALPPAPPQEQEPPTPLLERAVPPYRGPGNYHGRVNELWAKYSQPPRRGPVKLTREEVEELFELAASPPAQAQPQRFYLDKHLSLICGLCDKEMTPCVEGPTELLYVCEQPCPTMVNLSLTAEGERILAAAPPAQGWQPGVRSLIDKWWRSNQMGDRRRASELAEVFGLPAPPLAAQEP